jgi:5'-nucleotidase
MKKQYYCVISNDDGIKSAGLKAVFEALKPIADILVCAPDSQRSGASHSISCVNSIRVRKVKYYGSKAYAVSGTPADCAKLALLTFTKRKPGLFISGINHGPNTAQFILYSGTVGAAAEAAILGIPAIAFSIDSYEPEDFNFAVKYISKIALKILKGRLKIKKHTLLNINFPDEKTNGIKGVKILPKGLNEYAEKYIKKSAGTGSGLNTDYYWHIVGKKTKRVRHKTDADGVEAGFVTVTPLNFDLNDEQARTKLNINDFLI